jgi:hypothetical protein
MKDGNITRQELTECAKSITGTTLETGARHNKFLFYVVDEGFHYIPESTMKPRIQENRYIDRVIERYNERGTLSPRDYNDLTVNTSYLLAVIQQYINASGSRANVMDGSWVKLHRRVSRIVEDSVR